MKNQKNNHKSNILINREMMQNRSNEMIGDFVCVEHGLMFILAIAFFSYSIASTGTIHNQNIFMTRRTQVNLNT